MAVNLQLLGLQAIPRLAKKYDIKLEDFSGFLDLYGASPNKFQEAYHKSSQILEDFFNRLDISWWDVYMNSDIGMERIAVARDMELDEDETVLDVGCGRAYFTIAAARFSRRVIGLDAMNGMSRSGWWRNFSESISELRLGRRIQGLKGHAESIPLKDNSVDKAVSVHAVRNFRNRQAMQNAFQEMGRVISRDGEVVIVENIPIARNKAQEAHLAFFRCKCRYTSGDNYYFSSQELLQMVRDAGLTQVKVERVDYNLSATPPVFYLDSSALNEGEVEEAQELYASAIDMVKRHGEASPPALIIQAVKHSG